MIDQKIVEHIANLANIELDDAEAKLFSEQLSDVLVHFEHLKEVPTDEVETLYSPNPQKMKLREDEVKEFLSKDKILDNAPDRSGNLIKVPPVVS